MRNLRDAVAREVMGAVGLVAGALSSVALVVGAVVPAALGLLAFLASPLRGLLERLGTRQGNRRP